MSSLSAMLLRFRRDPLQGASRLVDRILDAQLEMRRLSGTGLAKSSLALKYRILSGERPEELLPGAFAHVREAARRSLGMEHYPVQLLGGIAMHRRGIAVMQTGEGKTLTATLPLYLAALAGQGAHLATANDYLASRDAAQMKPLFQLLGLSTGAVLADTSRPERFANWNCDVTYTTAKEIGFDFLRDRLLRRQLELGQQVSRPGPGSSPAQSGDDQPVLRDLRFVVVDEADSILIDEARTPLIISGNNAPPNAERVVLFTWAGKTATHLKTGSDFSLDIPRRTVELTASGRHAIRVAPKPPELDVLPLATLYEQVTLAITVIHFYQPDRHYVVRGEEVVIVDEFTGRLAEGRRWRSGIHQAIEVREGLPMTAETGESARTTLQDLFLGYRQMAGMTGTVANSASELEQIYRVRVCQIPTHRPPQRVQLPTRILPSEDAKWQAIAGEIKRQHATARPVLVGTRSIDKSEALSALLHQSGVPHQVLNARNHALEAELVANAGQTGAVTVATNMAGRGTDIRLSPQAVESGGLFVICSELHDSARIDRQLIGRCGRQGDPGSWQVFLSLEDDILKNGLPPQTVAGLRKSPPNHPVSRLERFFHRAQQKIEQRHFQARKLLMFQEQQRHQMQSELGMDPYLDAPQT